MIEEDYVKNGEILMKILKKKLLKHGLISL